MIGEPNDQGLHYVTLSATSNKHGLNENQNILVSLKSATVYIQTDKPIYRAEEYGRNKPCLILSLIFCSEFSNHPGDILEDRSHSKQQQ